VVEFAAAEIRNILVAEFLFDHLTVWYYSTISVSVSLAIVEVTVYCESTAIIVWPCMVAVLQRRAV